MPAYVIVQLSVDDPEAYERYKAPAADSVAAYGGTYLVRGGATETFEGEPMTDRFVVLQFPDAAAARAWYDSPEYREAAAIRRAASTTKRFFIVEGHAPPEPPAPPAPG